MLLELPPEIIQNILWHMDPGTLLISLLVCKRLYQIARSKDVLLHQLSSIPGLLIGLEDLSTSKALRQYRQRAARNLCGTDMLVQITRYQAGRDKINVPRCVFCPGSPPRLAIVFQYLSVIKLYGIEGGSLCPKADLEAQLFPYGNQECHIEVLKVAFSQAGHVAALYRYTPSDIGIGGPFLAEAFRRSKRTLKLVVFDLPAAEAQRTTGGICNPSDFQDARDVMVHGDFSPVSLTIANNGTAGISWARTGHRVNTKFSLYKRYDDTLGACRFDTSPKEFSNFGRPEDFVTSISSPSYNMQFTPDNSRLKFCRIGVPVYSWCADYSSEMERIGLYPTSKAVVLHGHRRDSVIVDMPFYQDHVRNFLPPTTTFPRRCVTKFLAIAITELGEDQQVFVILMTLETAADACHHQPMLYWNPRHEPVELIAKLDGFRRGSSSLGTVMAISPKGSRIALSDWSELRVWALNPGALHEDPLELYWPAQDICQECELVVIRPVQLPPRGVIHSMCWRDENELYAMTDQGLVRWDVGCRAYGKRESLSFELAT